MCARTLSPAAAPRGLPHTIRLPRSFYLRGALAVARDLPGMYLFRRIGDATLAGRIVEVEAYLGSRDPASHAYRGMTPRNEVMFGGGGHLYVYFTYGMHFCCNVVAGGAGSGLAVLIRAAEPVAGIDAMTRLRSTDGRTRNLHDLCSGPGKLCQAFGIRREENGTDLCGETIWIAEERGRRVKPRVARSRRIGISHGKEHLWRFHLRDDPFVSR
ncbi:MAG TPA: DNA-3-methyladenine glycosylase [Bacteroidota bacterium]|nr:DNA-3-methyladenine glycosylase [Bacteroidota bacterium]